MLWSSFAVVCRLPIVLYVGQRPEVSGDDFGCLLPLKIHDYLFVCILPHPFIIKVTHAESNTIEFLFILDQCSWV